MSGAATVGWCPGALRPMASGDGLILRVKPRAGRLTLDQAEAVADLSLRFGNGHLDLTGRANLQIRGAHPETLDALTRGLRVAGLLDADAGAEALRNIVASPLAGHDPRGFDVRPFVAALERCLAEPSASALRALPAKWSFLVDGGGRLPLAGVPADLAFRFDRAGTPRVGLDALWSEPLGDIDLPRMLARIASLVASQPQPLRMKGLLARLGPDAVFAHLGLSPAVRLTAVTPISVTDLFAPSRDLVAFAPPFGALSARTLAQALEACRAAGAGDLRLTPWRVLLATRVPGPAALARTLARFGLVVDAGDPRIGITACVGAPACHRADRPARDDAARLAARPDRRRDDAIHVSGCAKGCGRPPDATWTLMAREGRYDLFAEPDAAPRVTGLSFTEAANWLSRAERARTS